MNKGINMAVAKKNYILETVALNKIKNNDPEYLCVFISHRSTDKEDAIAVANLLRENGIDVYIDIDDEGLQIETQNDNPEGIVKHIQEALKYSTHLMALISDNTKESWWVPYEIGYAKHAEKKIASLRLKKNLDGFPDYLKIEPCLDNVDDLKQYIKNAIKRKSRYGSLFTENCNIEINEEIYKYVR